MIRAILAFAALIFWTAAAPALPDSSIPPKFPIAWGTNAGSSYILYPPFITSQQGITDCRASLNDGFPPKTFMSAASGGCPPFGQDMNGILLQITQWNQWQQAGGPVFYDTTFATGGPPNIGGYPKGAMQNQVSNSVCTWRSLVDNNTTDPDTGSDPTGARANWYSNCPTNSMQCDVKVWGAKGDGSTDDTAAFNACITFLHNSNISAGPGGILYAPPGYYCIKSPLTFNDTIIFYTSGIGGTAFGTCGADIALFTFNGPSTVVSDISICGKGINCPGESSFGASHAMITLGANCVGCKLIRSTILGGAPPLLMQGADQVLDLVSVADGYAGSFGSASAIVYNANAGIAIHIRRTAFDMNAPGSEPPGPGACTASWPNSLASAPGPRSNSQSITAGQIVSDQGYYLFACTNGTTGTGEPTLKNYLNNISDGSVTWRLVAPQGYDALLLERGADEIDMSASDLSCFPCSHALVMSNLLPGSATAGYLKVDAGTVFSASIFDLIQLSAGLRAEFAGNEIIGCAVLNCALLRMTNANTSGLFSGTFMASDNFFLGTSASTGSGVQMDGGQNSVIVNGNTFAAMNTAVLAGGSTPLTADNGVTITSNDCMSVIQWCVVISTNNDFYTIDNNAMNPGFIQDNGAGLHKKVQRSDMTGYANLQVDHLGVGAPPSATVPSLFVSNAGNGQAAFQFGTGAASGLLINQTSTGGPVHLQNQANNPLFLGANASDQWELWPNGGMASNGNNSLGVGTINAGGFGVNGSTGLNCSGSPTSSFASTGGIVTHC